MVNGIDKFGEHFAGYEQQYAVIGGAACELLFGEAGLPFRATKDIDMVLCIEVFDGAFAKRFKEFLDAGGYKARERSDGKKQFYRFSRPADESYPSMIELFSRAPGTLDLAEDATITPIPANQDIISLSAILLDDIYYQALQSAKRVIDGITVVDERLLIPFKARAFLDLTGRLENSEKIDAKDIRKHRNDVFRLIQLLPGDASIDVPEAIRGDLLEFIAAIGGDDTFDPKSFDVPMSRQDGIALLRSAYSLG